MRSSRRSPFFTYLSPTILAALMPFTATRAVAQEGWEWEPGEGYHQEEWYDPSDWFDDDSTVDYEYDGWYDSGYYDWYDGYSDGDYDWYDAPYYDWYDPYDNGYPYYGGWEPYDYYGGDLYEDEYDYYDYYDYDYGEPSRAYQDDGEDEDWYEDQSYDEESWDVPGYGQRRQQQGQRQQDEQQSRQQRQGRTQQQRTRSGQRSMQRQQRPSTAQQRTLAGTLQSWQRAEVQGQRDRQTLVKVKMRDGTSAIVNLGPRVDLGRLGLQQGDQVRFTGRTGNINGKRVLMARQLDVDGRTMRVRTTRGRQQGGRMMAAQRQERRQQAQQQPNRAQLRGRIADWRQIRLGDRPSHTFVKVELQDGRTRIIDLGPRVDLTQLEIDRGDRIVVQGRPARVEGHQVVMAERFRLDGQAQSLRGSTGNASQPAR